MATHEAYARVVAQRDALARELLKARARVRRLHWYRRTKGRR